MDEKTFKDGLVELNKEIEKRHTELKGQFTSKEDYEALKKSFDDLIEQAKEEEARLAKMQEQLDANATELKKAREQSTVKKYKEDPIKALITDNFDEIKTVRKGHGIKLDTKAVGDMLLGKYAMGYRNFRTVPYPEWWNEIIEFKPIER